MWTRMILLVAALAVVGCGGKNKDVPKGGSKGSMAPAPPSPEVKHIRKHLALSATEKERFGALEKLVKGWPRTRGALPAALGLTMADKENRGMLAMSLARVGKPLVAAINQMTAKAPLHLPTLRAAGALAYHLVARGGLTKRSDAEFAALRKALLPTVKRIRGVFNSDTRPVYEIYQGVAVGGEESIRSFKLPIVKDGLTRVAMVLYLILSNKANEALLPAAQRARLRKLALPLAKPFAEAMPSTRRDGTGESLDSLLIGISVLGIDAARALVAAPGMSKQPGCPIAIKAAHNLVEQFSVQEALPLRPLLVKCGKFDWKDQPNVPPALKQVLDVLAGKALKVAPKPGMGAQGSPAMAPGHGHDHGHDHKH